jgi:hypothetical protein
MKRYNMPIHEESRKRSIEGTNLTDQNTFSLLNTVDIVDIASGMGVNIYSM